MKGLVKVTDETNYWYFPNCIISQEFTSQVCPSHSIRPRSLFQPECSAPQPITATGLGPKCSLRHLRRPSLTCGKLHIRKVVGWKVTLGEMALRKYLTPNLYTQTNYTTSKEQVVVMDQNCPQFQIIRRTQLLFVKLN